MSRVITLKSILIQNLNQRICKKTNGLKSNNVKTLNKCTYKLNVFYVGSIRLITMRLRLCMAIFDRSR